MIRRKKLLKGGAVVLGVLVVGVWIAGEVVIDRTNPPTRHTGTILSAEADPVLRRACFDCHGNETKYPAYSYLPVASLLLGMHVKNGRHELNFSTWDRYPPQTQAKKVKESLEQIREGEMPTPDYLLMHPAARLSEADIAMITQAAKQRYGAVESKEDGGEREGKKD